jgi:hypothetical protein
MSPIVLSPILFYFCCHSEQSEESRLQKNQLEIAYLAPAGLFAYAKIVAALAMTNQGIASSLRFSQ